MLLDKRIRLVVKLCGEVSHKSLKRAVNLEGFGAVIFQNFSQDIQALFLKAWGFPRDTQEGPVYVFIIQSVWVYLLFVVWTVPFHASLPALEMLLGFLLEGVRCQILSVPEHNAHEAAAQPPKASSPTLPLLSMLSPPFQNNAWQLTSFSSQGPTWWHHLFCSLVFNCCWRLCECTHGGLVSCSDQRGF